MRQIIIALVVLLPLLANAQNFDTFYKNYSSKKGVESKKIGSTMLKVMAVASSKIPDGVEGFKTIVIKDNSKVDAKALADMAKDFSSIISSSAYKLIYQITEKGTTLKLYGKTNCPKKKVKDLLIYAVAEGKVSYSMMEGEIDEEVLKLPNK